MKSLVLLLAAFLFLAPQGSRAAGPSIILYQVNNVLTDRLGDDVAPFAKYIKSLDAAAQPFLEKGEPERLDAFIIIKPGEAAPVQRTRVWLVSSLSPAPDRSALKKALESVPPPIVEEGSVVFTLCFVLHGAAPRENGTPPIFPDDWKSYLPKSEGPPTLTDAFLKNVWPD